MSMAYTEIGKKQFSSNCPIIITISPKIKEKQEKQHKTTKHWQHMNKGAYKQGRKIK